MSSKRKKESKKAASKPAIEDNSNFVRMIVYTIIGVLGVFVIAIYFMKANPEDLDPDEANADGSGGGNGVQIVEDDGPNALIAKLQQSNMQERSLKRDELENHLRNHIKLSEELIESGETDAQKTDGYGEKIGALVKLNALVPETAFPELKTFVESLREVQIPNVNLMGRIAMLNVMLNRELHADKGNLQPVFDAIESDMSAYKNSQAFANMVVEFVRKLFEYKKQDQALILMKAVLPHFRESSNEQITKHVMRFEGMIGMETHSVTKHFEDIVNGKSESTNLFLDALQKMIDDQSLNELIYVEVITAIRALEKRNLYDAARIVNTEFGKKLASYKNENVANAGKIDTAAALLRLDMMDKPFQPAVFNKDGEPFDFKGLNGDVTVVVFVSLGNPGSVNTYRSLIGTLGRLPDKPFRLASVITDDKPWEGIKFLKTNAPEWLQFPIMVTAPDDNNPRPETLQKMGIQAVPFVIILDRNGIVRDIDVTQATMQKSVMTISKGNSKTQGSNKLSPNQDGKSKGDKK